VTIRVVLLVAILMAWQFAFASPFGSECELHGSIKIDGNLAPVGTELVAVIGTEEVARATVKEAGDYTISIPEKDLSSGDSKGWESEDDVITVYVDGKKATPTFNAKAGKNKLDLTVSTTLEVKQTTWGKIKALFK